jgi:hypothetical protein
VLVIECRDILGNVNPRSDRQHQMPILQEVYERLGIIAELFVDVNPESLGTKHKARVRKGLT